MDKGYECHLTFDAAAAEQVEKLCPYGWKFSRIEGDPVLGQRLYCYWTTWDNHQCVIEDTMRFYIQRCRELALPLVRAKIEHIIYDQRY